MGAGTESTYTTLKPRAGCKDASATLLRHERGASATISLNSLLNGSDVLL
jgi:hypothetical protein